MSEIASSNQHDGPVERRRTGRIARTRRLVFGILRARTDRTLAQRTAFLAFFIRASSAAIAS